MTHLVRQVLISIFVIVACGAAWGQYFDNAYKSRQDLTITYAGAGTSTVYKSFSYSNFPKDNTHSFKSNGFLSMYFNKGDTATADTISITSVALKGWYFQAKFYPVNGRTNDSLVIWNSGTALILPSQGLPIPDAYRSFVVMPCDSLLYSVGFSKTATSTRNLIVNFFGN